MASSRYKTSATSMRNALRRQKAVELRASGLTLEEVGTRMGITKEGAFKLINATLEEYRRTTAQEVETVRALELARLDKLQQVHWLKACAGDNAATDRVLNIMRRRAQLLGLDAPVKIEDVVPVTGPPSLIVQFVDAPRYGADNEPVLTIAAGAAAVRHEEPAAAPAANDSADATCK